MGHTSVTSAGTRYVSDLGPHMKVTQIKNEKVRLHAIWAFHTVMKRTDLNLIWAAFFICSVWHCR